jgi:hypothetical protein
VRSLLQLWPRWSHERVHEIRSTYRIAQPARAADGAAPPLNRQVVARARPTTEALGDGASCTPATSGYTTGMKTAVSLPDEVFRAAERQARRAKKSRSQLYAEALSEYLARHAPDEVTDAMNRVVEQLREPTNPFVSVAARRVLERSEW